MMVKRLLKSFHPVVQNAVFLGSGQICWSLSDFCGVELGIRKAGDSRELRHPARHSPAILFIFSAKLFAQRRLLVKHNKKMEEQPETRICWNHGGLATQDNFRNLPVKSISGGRVLRNLLSGFKANS